MSPLAAVEREPIPPGTLDMLILKTLAGAPARELHGFAIADAIQRGSRDVLQVEEGSLYPALQRMLLKGWISGEWSRTAAGKRQLEREIAAYQRVTRAIAYILQPA
jgi:DNA-binding PadR family transcriptional regulator